MRTLHSSLAALTVVFAFGCSSPSPPPAPANQQVDVSSALTLANHDWTLVSLGDQRSPKGAGDRPLTLRFDAASGSAAGFSGCNTYRGAYTLTRDRLQFGPIAYTKMACRGSDDIERKYLATLRVIVSYVVTGSTLTLNGVDGPLARFTRSST